MSNKMKVYYDGGCIVCSREVDHYEKRDSQKRIEYVDISRGNFDFKSEGLDPLSAKKYFHVRKDGKLIVGVEGFLQIWKELQIWPVMIWLAETSWTRFILNQGYALFIRIRPLLPRKECEPTNCQF